MENCRTFVSVSRLRDTRSRAPIRRESSALQRSPACNSSCRCALLPFSLFPHLSLLWLHSKASPASFQHSLYLKKSLLSSLGECVDEKRESFRLDIFFFFECIRIHKISVLSCIVHKSFKVIRVFCDFSLFCIHQESQQWLSRLIPDKQCLNDQLKQVQQNSLHSKNTFLNTALKIQNSRLVYLVQSRIQLMSEFS